LRKNKRKKKSIKKRLPDSHKQDLYKKRKRGVIIDLHHEKGGRYASLIIRHANRRRGEPKTAKQINPSPYKNQSRIAGKVKNDPSKKWEERPSLPSE